MECPEEFDGVADEGLGPEEIKVSVPAFEGNSRDHFATELNTYNLNVPLELPKHLRNLSLSPWAKTV